VSNLTARKSVDCTEEDYRQTLASPSTKDKPKDAFILHPDVGDLQQQLRTAQRKTIVIVAVIA